MQEGCWSDLSDAGWNLNLSEPGLAENALTDRQEALWERRAQELLAAFKCALVDLL